MLFLYRVSLAGYQLIVWIFSFFNTKAKLFLEGRHGVFEQLEHSIKTNKKVIWIHAASVGEFEQGRPLIESIRKEKIDCFILLTFYSPSGYQLRKNYDQVDHVSYLPMDSPGNARRLISIANPKLVVFIKYEFWYFYMNALQEKKIPTIFISCILREKHFLFGPFGRFYQKLLKGIDHYYVQDELTGKQLAGIGIDQFTVSGDTRFDRVMEIAQNAGAVPLVESFINGEEIMVIGSAWGSDLEVIKPFILKQAGELKFIIAPHNIEEHHLEPFDRLPNSIRYSQLTKGDHSGYRILIIDNIGVLSRLYRYARFALVGGAFNGTLHNVLEAAVYGIPVFFGQHENNRKFLEAKGLIQSGGGFSFADAKELSEMFDSLHQDESNYKRAATAAGEFVKGGTGATALITQKVKKYL
ncbi:MAG: 3-deoxy-D-manno-octulosonic acid transferase [Cyclobacteriaceae bacterium]|nr:3-deoxy-D-manno-octulosonic acid transferase [Cyclobacteriaceae bacterium SS2]